jgi:acetoin utilization deacetylase AcuC-like enzyme
MVKVGFVYDPIYLKHDTGSHPENAKRVLTIMRYLERTGPWQQLSLIKPEAATKRELSLVHTEQYISEVQELAEKGGGQLDLDTVVSTDSYKTAIYAVGGVIKATDVVIGGDMHSVFALVRPPGHHATASRGMGFCLFNNVAIATKYALIEHKLDRIAIIDFDVHHGNGTQDVFYNDVGVLYISTHQSSYYPGTGSIDETGEGLARGTTVNIPLPAGCGDREYEEVFLQIIIPVVRRFQPQLIIISSGYDGHWSDRLAGMQLSIAGFTQIVRLIKQTAEDMCAGRMVFSLEGGYNLPVLSASVRATFEVLLGNTDVEDKFGQLPFEVKSPDINHLLQKIKKIHNLY